MAKIKVPYLVAKPGAAGKIRHYWQPTSSLKECGWRSTTLSNDPATAIGEAQAINARLDAWRQGEDLPEHAAPSTATARGTLDHVIERYQRHWRFARLKPSTRKGYAEKMRVLAAWGGEDPVGSITAASISEFYEAMYFADDACTVLRTPAKANAVIRMLHIVLEFARRPMGLIDDNPADRPGLIGIEAPGIIWPRAAIAPFVAAADANGAHSIGTAVILNEWLGQRQGDILTLPRDLCQAGGFVLTQAKTNARVKLPLSVVPALEARVKAEISRQDDKALAGMTLLLDETTGLPYKRDHFQKRFAAIRAIFAAAHPSFDMDWETAEGEERLETRRLCFFHLRHTAVTRLSEAECTPQLIASITGHSIKTVETITDRYLVRTADLARTAFEKRLAKERNE